MTAQPAVERNRPRSQGSTCGSLTAQVESIQPLDDERMHHLLQRPAESSEHCQTAMLELRVPEWHEVCAAWSRQDGGGERARTCMCVWGGVVAG